jgi:hypothetical protein
MSSRSRYILCAKNVQGVSSDVLGVLRGYRARKPWGISRAVRKLLLACRVGSLSGKEKKLGIGNEILDRDQHRD